MSRKKGRAKRELKRLDKRLKDKKFAGRVVKKARLKRQDTIIKRQVERLETALKNAKGPQRERIQRLINILKKAQGIGETAFYEK